MRLRYYLTEVFRDESENVSRAKGISEDQARQLLKTHCKDSVQDYIQGNYLGRGTKDTTDFTYVDPTQHVRKSAYVGSNYYNLILSNHKSWSKYPRRDQSLVCHVGQSQSNYGTPYIVLPFDGSRIGICPAQDIWLSFMKTWKQTLDLVSNDLGITLKEFTGRNVIVASWPELESAITETADILQARFTNGVYDDESGEYIKGYQDERLVGLMRGFHSVAHGRFDQWLYKLFSPAANKFKLTKAGNLPSSASRPEAWTDGKSVLISIGNKYQMSIVDDMVDSIT